MGFRFKRWLKSEITVILVFALSVYLVLVVAVYHTQSYIIFHSGGASSAPPEKLDVDEFVLTTPDGEQLHAWWLHTEGAEKTILYFQPNSTNISYHIPRLDTFQKMGVNCLIFDYRGYGKSTGRIKTEEDIYTDGLTAWKYLTVDKKIGPEEIILWGRSLGGGVAAEIAQLKNIAALVLESTFYSLDEVASRRFWYFPTKRLLKFHFENGRKLHEINAPVVIIHSVEDNYIPLFHAEKLFETAKGPKFFIKTTGSHIDSFDYQVNPFGNYAETADTQKDTLAAIMKYLEL